MPYIDEAVAADLAGNVYGLAGSVTLLPGEVDQNFKLKTPAGSYLLKVSSGDTPPAQLEYQTDLLNHLNERQLRVGVPKVHPDRDGKLLSYVPALDVTVRLLSYLEGRPLYAVRPHMKRVLESLGEALAELDLALKDFHHPEARRTFKWNPAQAGDMRANLPFISSDARRRLAERHFDTFAGLEPSLDALPKSVIHNDANDHNVLVQGTGYDAAVTGVIDFGDAVFAPTVCNLAVALAYAMLAKADPLTTGARVVRGYNKLRQLGEDELAALFPLVLTRLAVSVTNSAAEQRRQPENSYLTVSEAPAWALLEKLESVHPRLAHYQFRAACGLEPVPATRRLKPWLNKAEAACFPLELAGKTLQPLDLSVASLDLGLPETTATVAAFTELVFDDLLENGAYVGCGGYLEPRLVYASDAFATPGENGVEYRTVHLGLDFFAPAGTLVKAVLAGTVHSIKDNTDELDYGPCVILEHTSSRREDPPFYTLYGHLSRASTEPLTPGQKVERGEVFAALGPYPENGNWPPHLHFQIITDLLGYNGTFPGVARARDLNLWSSLSPDPSLLLPPLPKLEPHLSKDEILERRSKHIGRNLSVSYAEPLQVVRGSGQYLYDAWGARFLDCYNNVPHVGHQHPHVVKAAQKQLTVLNTNTRYLHEHLVRYAERLTAKFPEPLSVCYIVNSGSEATELALRLARAHTGQRDLIVSDGAYHGHTTTLIDVSPYKAEGPGGKGLPDWVHKAPVADTYRGAHKRDDAEAGVKYARALAPIIETIQAAGRGLSGFMIESIPSVAGQIVLPDGYLAEAYRRVRAAGGVCIADEVQTGFGRVGSHFWAFETQGVVPDIVALGKPIGNGQPLAAVVTTPEIAASFDNGMEYFATFGGNPVSCAVGLAVLDVLEAEKLQEHALHLGSCFMAQLRDLAQRHGLIGDVRGMGLFIGIELVEDRETLEPAAEKAAYIVNRLRDHNILTGTDGLYHNVVKLRGPLVIQAHDVDRFVAVLDGILEEDACWARG